MSEDQCAGIGITSPGVRRKKRSKKFWVLIVFFLFLCVLFSGCIAAVFVLYHNAKQGGFVEEEWDENEGTVYSSLAYAAGEKNLYDLYIHKDIPKGKNVPFLLLIHGGGWTTGTRDQMTYACRYYGRQGCITATMDYSLIDEKHPEITLETMMKEIGQCIDAVRNRVEAEGYLVPKVAVGGYSAGGHLALQYSYSRTAQSPLPVAFVFEKVGPTSFSSEIWGDKNAAALTTGGTGHRVNPEDINTPEAKALIDSVSPVHFVTPDSCPTIFAYGGKDTLVPLINRDMLLEVLEKNHVPNICVDFPNSDHAMWNDSDCVRIFRDSVLLYCRKYMELPAPTI